MPEVTRTNLQSTNKFRKSTTMVTLPMAGTYMDALSLISGVKFYEKVLLASFSYDTYKHHYPSYLLAREVDTDGSLP